MSRFAVSLLLAALVGCRATAPATTPTPRAATHRRRAPVDLRRGVDTRALEQYARTMRFTVGRPTSFRVTPDGSAALFLRAPDGSAARALHQWDRAANTERVLVTAEQLLGGADESLSPEERARRERQRVSGRGLTSYTLSPDGARVLVPFSGRLFVLERSTGAVTELPSAGGAPVDARFSPDGRAVGLVRGGELAVIDLATRRERALTHGATADRTHAVAEFVAQEELDRMEGWWWSPDATKIAWQETDLSRVERLRISDPTAPARTPDETPWPRAGTPNADVRVGVVPVAGGATTWVTWDRAQFPYLVTVRWSRNAPLTLVVMNRAQREVQVLAAADDGSTRVLHRERDDAWVNTSQDFPHWLPDGQSFLWATERGGRLQVERHARDGAVLTAVTPATLNLRDVVGFDDVHGALYAIAGDDPTTSQLVRVTGEGESAVVEPITHGAGERDAVVSDDGTLRVVTTHALDAMPRTTVLDGDGRELTTVRSYAEAPMALPAVTLRTVGDDHVQAAVLRPREYRTGRRYPVIAWVYGGPHARVVTAGVERYFVQQWLADQGFIVVLADGRGTPGRGRDWERALHLRVGEVPLEAQVEALRALAADDPTLDTSRVGVIGWSFGGYLAARAVLARPDVFHAAVAGAPVTDWREYDTCYTERYLGLPDEQPDAYAQASLLPLAAGLRRPLMLVHGTADDNVYFHNSLRLAEALVRAGRRFEFVPLVGQTHGVHEPELVMAWLLRARQFFVDALQR